jgi:hypothetical protein
MDMTIGAIQNITILGEEITAVVSDGLNLWLGTNQGNIYKYVYATAVVTKIGNAGSNVIDLAIYGGFLYAGVLGGRLTIVALS